jgi:flagellar protein FlgJ
MVVKQMRQASLGDGLLDSKQSQSYRDMYDQQISSHMADTGGLGLAPVIKRQLGGEVTVPAQGRGQADYMAAPTQRAPALNPALPSRDRGFDGPADFVQRLRPHAEQAAARLGMPAEALLAQAALETGWGKAVMERPEGGISHNLFGIKADRRWDGDQVKVSTLEYRDGVAMKTRAAFRAYDSYADSFADYARFITGNPRYREALESAGDPKAYFEALQQAGYATDPSYARKVLDILQRPELRAALDAQPRPAAEA